MPRTPRSQPLTPAARKRRSRASGRATAERINKVILEEFKTALIDYCEGDREGVSVWDVYARVASRFPGETGRVAAYLIPLREDDDPDENDGLTITAARPAGNVQGYRRR